MKPALVIFFLKEITSFVKNFTSVFMKDLDKTYKLVHWGGTFRVENETLTDQFLNETEMSEANRWMLRTWACSI